MKDGDGWKGEPEQPPPHPLVALLTPRPLTPEELEQQETARRKQVAQAETAALSLSPFVLNRACAKCRCPGEPTPHHVQYSAQGNPSQVCYALGAIGEHFDRVCRLCGYLWVETVPA